MTSGVMGTVEPSPVVYIALTGQRVAVDLRFFEKCYPLLIWLFSKIVFKNSLHVNYFKAIIVNKLTKGGVKVPEIDIKDIWNYANNIIRTSRKMVNEGLRSLDLSSSEGNILLHLFTQDHELRQEDIVEDLDLSKPAVSRALKSLEKKGYVKRNKDSSDRRASRILLTDKSREIRTKVEQIYNEVYSIAAQGVSGEEITFFINLFSRVSDNFSRATLQQKDHGRQNDVI